MKLFFKKCYVELRATASGGAQPNLNLTKVKNRVLPLPPLAEQKRIVAKVDSLMALCDELESSLKASSGLSEKLATAVVGHLN